MAIVVVGAGAIGLLVAGQLADAGAADDFAGTAGGGGGDPAAAAACAAGWRIARGRGFDDDHRSSRAELVRNRPSWRSCA